MRFQPERTAHAELRGTENEPDFLPAVKLFMPERGFVWLLAELDPEQPDIAFGLCDLGMACPELGSVSLSENRIGSFGQRPCRSARSGFFPGEDHLRLCRRRAGTGFDPDLIRSMCIGNNEAAPLARGAVLLLDSNK